MNKGWRRYLRWPTFRQIPGLSCSVGGGAVGLLGALAIRGGADASDVLAFLGGVAGAGIGAWLAVAGALHVEHQKSLREDQRQEAVVVAGLFDLGSRFGALFGGPYNSIDLALLQWAVGVHESASARAHQELSDIRAAVSTAPHALLDAIRDVRAGLVAADKTMGRVARIAAANDANFDQEAAYNSVNHAHTPIIIAVNSAMQKLGQPHLALPF